MTDFTPVTPTLFRNAFARLPTGVTIVTAGNQENPVGITIGSLASLSLDPPMLSFALDKKSKHKKNFHPRAYFLVHMLSAAQAPLAELFATPGRRDWPRAMRDFGATFNYEGLPIIPACPTIWRAKVAHNISAGDHRLILARIKGIALAKDPPPPLVHANRTYGVLR